MSITSTNAPWLVGLALLILYLGIRVSRCRRRVPPRFWTMLLRVVAAGAVMGIVVPMRVQTPESPVGNSGWGWMVASLLYATVIVDAWPWIDAPTAKEQRRMQALARRGGYRR